MKRPEAIVVGCSAGGLDALKILLAGLDPQLSQPVLVCCHSGADTVELLCELLARASTLPVVEAVERTPPRGGVVHVAPSGYHLLVEADGCFALSTDPRVSHARPSIDVLFGAAADVWRQALIGVVLTGANADGAQGLLQLRRNGGCAIVQSPADAVAKTMPQAALDIAGADHCVPLDAVAPLLNRLCCP
ncbi:MAG: chemotaxis protein CheB [Rhodanobacter sp.]|nr:MAG: chemotaxis protein CheB [Rhodanobacter sp.]